MNRRLRILRFVATKSGRYAWQSLKNLIKFFLGRKPYYDWRLVFIRKYLLHLTGLCPIRGITSVDPSGREGPGSQANLIMNAINFARISGIPYLHTPLKNVFGADRPMQEWAAAWESLFNLGVDEVACDPGRRDVVNYCIDDWFDIELCFGWQDRAEQLSHHFKSMIPEFRRKYYSDKSPGATNEVTVAVNIRRGEVSADRNNRLFTATEIVRQTTSDVRTSLDSLRIPYSIRVYSQGEVTEFEELAPLGVEFILNADPIWTIRELIEADILIVANSSFSFYAGIISDGIKIFEPNLVTPVYNMFMPSWGWTVLFPEDDWFPRRKDGSIDAAAFERQVSLLIEAKKKARQMR